MSGGRSPSTGTRAVRPPSAQLIALEPYAVAVAAVMGGYAALREAEGAALPLVVLCWVLFLLDRPRAPLRSWGPPGAAAVAGALVLCGSNGWLPSGIAQALFALLSAGAAYLLLPDPRLGSELEAS